MVGCCLAVFYDILQLCAFLASKLTLTKPLLLMLVAISCRASLLFGSFLFIFRSCCRHSQQLATTITSLWYIYIFYKTWPPNHMQYLAKVGCICVHHENITTFNSLSKHPVSRARLASATARRDKVKKYNKVCPVFCVLPSAVLYNGKASMGKQVLHLEKCVLVEASFQCQKERMIFNRIINKKFMASQSSVYFAS